MSAKRDDRRKGLPRRPESLTGPGFVFASQLAEEQIRDFKRGRGRCCLCRSRGAVALYQKALGPDQARRLGTAHRKATVTYQGVCERCARLPDLDARLDEDLDAWLDTPGSVPIHDLGDIPFPECLGGRA